MGTRGSPHGNAQLVPRTDALDPRAQEGRHSRAGLSAAAVDLGRYVPQELDRPPDIREDARA